MELLLIFGLALFLIIVSAVMFLIFGHGDVGTAAMMVMAVVIISAAGLGVFMTIASIFPSFGIGSTDTDNMDVPMLRSMRSPIEIVNITICSNPDTLQPEPCSGPDLQPTNDVVLYWQVPNGVGCCATYHCLYPVFEEACLKPFRLYDLYLDGVQYVDWDNFNLSRYTYTCGFATPWNYWTFNNLSLGQHTITVDQKDCTNVVATKYIVFNLIWVDEGYYVEVLNESII